MKTKILHQYILPFELQNLVVLSSEKSVGFGWSKSGYRFLTLSNGTYQVLDYVDPEMPRFSVRCALFATKPGFGCVFDTKIVYYSFESEKFEEVIITTPLPKDHAERTIGPVKAVAGNNEYEIFVLQEDYFHEGIGRFLSSLLIEGKKARYTSLISIPFNSQNAEHECSDVSFKSRPLLHKSSYLRTYIHRDTDETQYCKFNNDGFSVITETHKGFGNFSSDKQHLIVRTYTRPYYLKFYLLSGEIDFEIKLTPKRVLGEVDKRLLKVFDKSGNRLWLSQGYNVTEVSIEKTT